MIVPVDLPKTQPSRVTGTLKQNFMRRNCPVESAKGAHANVMPHPESATEADLPAEPFWEAPRRSRRAQVEAALRDPPVR